MYMNLETSNQPDHVENLHILSGKKPESVREIYSMIFIGLYLKHFFSCLNPSKLCLKHYFSGSQLTMTCLLRLLS